MNSSISKSHNPYSASIWFRSVIIGIVSLLFPALFLFQTGGHLVKGDTSISTEAAGTSPGDVAVNPLTDKDNDSNRGSDTVGEIGGMNTSTTFNGVGFRDITHAPPPMPTPTPGTGAIRLDAFGEGIGYVQGLPEDWDA